MITFDEKIIELDIIDLDYILYPYHGDYQTLIVKKSTEKDLYLLKEITVGDEDYSNVVVGISENIKEIKDKMREYVKPDDVFPYCYRLVGGIDKETYKIEGSLTEFEVTKNEKTLKVEYKPYKAQTELGELFLVDALVTVLDEERKLTDEFTKYAFLSEKEMRKFVDETFREKITEEVFAEY